MQRQDQTFLYQYNYSISTVSTTLYSMLNTSQSTIQTQSDQMQTSSDPRLVVLMKSVSSQLKLATEALAQVTLSLVAIATSIDDALKEMCDKPANPKKQQHLAELLPQAENNSSQNSQGDSQKRSGSISRSSQQAKSLQSQSPMILSLSQSNHKKEESNSQVSSSSSQQMSPCVAEFILMGKKELGWLDHQDCSLKEREYFTSRLLESIKSFNEKGMLNFTDMERLLSFEVQVLNFKMMRIYSASELENLIKK